ncbi:hypothetical protein ScPMuIL_003942 [Solemya velum]
MTRLTQIALAQGPYKKFNNYKKETVKYRHLLPPVLRDFVSSRGENIKAVPCLQELTVMMSCWKDNDFVHSKCSKQIQDFQNCWTAAEEAAKMAKVAEMKGHVVAGERPKAKTVNAMLKKYPQPKHSINIKC